MISLRLLFPGNRVQCGPGFAACTCCEIREESSETVAMATYGPMIIIVTQE